MLPPPTPIAEYGIERLKFNNTKTYKLEDKNDIFQLKISINETLIFFELEKLNLIPKKYFNIHLSLKELGKINKFFKQFDTIQEVFFSFDTLLESNNIFVFEEEKKAKLKINNPANKKEFYLDIPLKEKTITSEISSIYEYINSLNNKIIDLEKKVDDLCNFKEEYLKRKKEKEKNKEKGKEKPIEKIKDTKDTVDTETGIKIEEKKENENEKEKEKKEEEKKEEETLNIFKDSNIIQNNDDIKLILSWLNKKSIKTNLLFNSKTDGYTLSDLYKKVENKSPILVIIKTKKGNIFGGYSNLPLKCDEKWHKDDNSFIFSFNTKNKYNAKSSSKTHILANDDLFEFGNDIRICNFFTQTNTNYVGKCDYDSPDNYELNAGKRNYTVLNLEIYEIIL